jgi:alkylation response protein AidB-like acyl-CoA dehydrogenase
MAYASYAGFQHEPALKVWADKVRGTQYEFSRREVADKPAVVVGYAMTEKQGGSDLRETQTSAVYSHAADYHGAAAHWYELTGHKWFCSVPQSDGFFTLAKVAGEVTCFFCRAPCRTAAQPLPDPAPEGQVRQPLERIQRDRVQRHAGDPGGPGRRRVSARSCRTRT